MSRSRRPRCTTGRGCWCCGDAGKVRRRREAEAGRADLVGGLSEWLDSPPRPGLGEAYDGCECEWCIPDPHYRNRSIPGVTLIAAVLLMVLTSCATFGKGGCPSQPSPVVAAPDGGKAPDQSRCTGKD